ncbi:sensor histidine kinase [Actinoplanes sp. TRM 88003]|uniref:histidine kinase n=1 Tax=Paractinoplanes aksuensis TaxID=2939490 RepID=A0ABT1DSK4_9ACTN|nr:sensor histidine kinase [Actinoplanes aksuensis]MCO8273795.1 sensor histidine kinase [Actinoplanes aksuensis]
MLAVRRLLPWLWWGALLIVLSLVAFVLAPAGNEIVLGLALLVLVVVTVLLWRGHRLSALATLLAATAGVLLVGADSQFVQALAIPLIIFSDVVLGMVAALDPPRRARPALVVTAAAQAGWAMAQPGPDVLVVLVIEGLALVTAWVIGLSLGQRRRYAAAQREQAETRAVQAERLRIARELHDMIAHSFGVISVQAGMGRRVIDTQPEEARTALANIEETSRDTAAALRRMLGTLRRTDPGSGPELRDPAPGLADLDALVTRSAQAGVRVEVRREGDRTPLPPEIDLSAYRIIQESVTNVIRHAGVDHCEVLVTQHGDELTVEVTDLGRGGRPSFGYGLSGMRERVSLLDGQFEAGPGPDGGFRIRARLPLPALTA